ncbi:MAG: ribonuclease III family protein [Candidatus Thorarchaeota archaeon]|jgi:dsRNA-specific ribonuclease
MWSFVKKHQSVADIMKDKGLAKVGDGLVNLCYSLAKSEVLGEATGEKVRDSVLAQALRATPIYNHITRRTDSGAAADAFEAIVAYLWLTDKTTTEFLVSSLVEKLDIHSKMSRKQEGEAAARAFQSVLEGLMDLLPDS